MPSTYRYESQEAVSITPAPTWKGLDNEQVVDSVMIGDSGDPVDKSGYAIASADGGGLPDETTSEPGEEKTFSVRVAVGDSPLAAYGVLASQQGSTVNAEGIINDSAGHLAIHGLLRVSVGGKWLSQYRNSQGRVAFRLPTGSHDVQFVDIGPRHGRAQELRAEPQDHST